MAFETELSHFQTIPLFELLDAEALRLLAFSAESRVFRDGETLETGGALLLIKGAFRVAHGAASRQFAAPALIREMALLIEQEQPDEARAHGEASGYFISRALFRRILAEYPDSARSIAALIQSRAEAIRAGIANLAK